MSCAVFVSHPQIHSECKRFGKAYNLRSVAVYGGGSMWEQAKALQEGAEIVVCTPVSTCVHQVQGFALLSLKKVTRICSYDMNIDANSRLKP